MSETSGRRPHIIHHNYHRDQSLEDPKIALKSRHYLNFLYNRELGETAGVPAEKEFYRMKASHKEKTSSSNLQIPSYGESYNDCEVIFIKGDDQSLFGAWCMSDDFNDNYYHYVRSEISYRFDENSSHYSNYKRCENIIDMCRGSTDFITVCNYPPPHQTLSFVEIGIVRVYDHNEQDEGSWYSCCFVHRTNSAVIGGKGCLQFISFDYGHMEIYRPFKENVYTLSYHEPSGSLLAGLHTGNLSIMDTRIDGNTDICFIKISDEAVNDTVFLNHQELIVADAQGKLVKVDLRARKISAEFFGHKHSVIKRPFSVANDMLCATGADNVVRIWDVSGGHPIHVHKSTSGHEVRGWLNDGGNKTYLNYFERDTRTVFTI